MRQCSLPKCAAHRVAHCQPNRTRQPRLISSSESFHPPSNHLGEPNSNTEAPRSVQSTLRPSLISSADFNAGATTMKRSPRRWSVGGEARVKKRWPLYCSGGHSFPRFKRLVTPSSLDARPYHMTQMSEWMLAGLRLWWELLVMHGGTW